MRVRILAPLVIAIVALATASSLQAAPSPKPSADPGREAVVKALATGGDIPGQARNLVQLAWPAGKRDEVISERARLELAHFGSNSMVALRDAVNSVPIAYTEEVVATTLAAKQESRVEMQREYVPVVIDALWVGSHGAKVLAIRALSLDRTGIAVMPMIDSAIADPSLAQLVVETLGALRYEHARFYLEKVMMEGSPALRSAAAVSLARIGGAALTPLKTALKSDSRDVRLLAARTLLPIATEYEVGALYEYIEKHGDDDPALTEGIKFTTVAIEKAIAARDAKAAADSPKDF